VHGRDVSLGGGGGRAPQLLHGTGQTLFYRLRSSIPWSDHHFFS
jgi:hypothetical protein